MTKPIAIDLFSGLGGWAEGLLSEGWSVIGYDIEAHQYGDQKYPGKLVIQDVLTIHGSQFKDADLIVASPPCQFFSYVAMPWSRGKALAEKVRNDPVLLDKELALFRACFRIQREASEAAGRHIPMIVENVRGAQKWVGKARWNFGSYYLWGDVPALMPIPVRRRMKSAISCSQRNWCDRIASTPEEAHTLHYKLPKMGGMQPSEYIEKLAYGGEDLAADGYKSSGMNWSDQTKRGQDFTRLAAKHCSVKGEGGSWFGGTYAERKERFPGSQITTSSKSKSRKAASAMIAKIPFPLAQWIARTFKPKTV